MERWIGDDEGRAAWEEWGGLRAAHLGRRWPPVGDRRVAELDALLAAWRRQGLAVDALRCVAHYAGWKLFRRPEQPPEYIAATYLAAVNAGSVRDAEDLVVAAESPSLTPRGAWKSLQSLRARAADVLRERPALRLALCRIEPGPPRDLWRPPADDDPDLAEAIADATEAEGTGAPSAPPAGPRMR